MDWIIERILGKANRLRWKIWLMNEAESEAGGVYCFEDEAAAGA